MERSLLIWAVVFGVVLALLVTIAEHLGGSTANWGVIVVGILCFGPLLRRFMTRV